MKDILIINKDPQINRILKNSLEKDGYTVMTASNGEEGLHYVQKKPSLIVFDTFLPDIDGYVLLKVLKDRAPQSIFIALLSANVTKEEVCKAGVHEYLEKPFTIFALNLLIEDTLQRLRHKSGWKKENNYDQTLILSPFTIGSSALIQEVQNRIKYLISTHTHILISGEKGTGKEEIGKIIHLARNCDNSPFVSVDLAVLPWLLQESQLFLNPSSTHHGGACYQAQDGTLFIGSLEKLTKEMQEMFLQTLKENRDSMTTIAQIITSTTADIDELAEKGEFDRELLELLGTERLVIPPLRMRREDIKTLTSYFLDEIKNTTSGGPSLLSPDVEHYLLSNEWVNNVKELKRTVMRACVIAKGERITMDDIHPQKVDSIGEFLEKKLNSYMHNIKRIENFKLYETVISEVERALILITLKETHGNQVKASKLLGINRNTLKKKINQLHIDVNDFKTIPDTYSSS